MDEEKILAFCRSLKNDEIMLVIFRDELYGGSWDLMIDDLKARLKKKPYIFNLMNKIESDIKRIKKMKNFEKKHNISLSDYVKNLKEGR